MSMCSCTDVASEVPRMDSSSSSEMKKKRGKAQRLVSKYSLSDFWHSSSCSDRLRSASSLQADVSACQLEVLHFRKMFQCHLIFHWLDTVLELTECCCMSNALKIYHRHTTCWLIS